MAWPDERLDDLGGRMDAGFERVDDQIGELRTEMQQGFKDVRAEMQRGLKDVRAEMQQGFKDVRTEMQQGLDGLRTELKGDINGLDGKFDRMYGLMIVTLVTVLASLVGVFGAILATGSGG
jgi:hypothetical protein